MSRPSIPAARNQYRDRLKVWAHLLSAGFSGSASDPKQLELNAPLEFLEAYYYPGRTVVSYTPIRCNDRTCVAVAGETNGVHAIARNPPYARWVLD